MNDTASAAAEAAALTALDAPWFQRAFAAGVSRVFAKRDYINKINVFPVADADTGTNLAFTLSAVLGGIRDRQFDTIGALFDDLAEFAVDGARGNSGAIFAQFIQGFAEAVADHESLDTRAFGRAAVAGATAAGSAVVDPREGTMLSVIRDCAREIERRSATTDDFRPLLRRGLERARASLAATPEHLEVLRRNNVVDAGAQGFVEWLEGVTEFALTGSFDLVELELVDEDRPGIEIVSGDVERPEHRFCTECMISGDGIDRNQLRDAILRLDVSSLVIAGTRKKVRLHVHVNHPGKVFLACEEFGAVTSQKADDMRQQTASAHDAAGTVAVVADTGADIPEDEIERLRIHLVPLRVNFGDRQFLDKVSIGPGEFFGEMREGQTYPRTSQPPPGDFRRQFEFLRSHHDAVISINISGALSGTWQNADLAARRCDADAASVRAYDTRNASAGQALMAMYAAEAAEAGLDLDQIIALLDEMSPLTRTYAVIEDLQHGVRGGRLSPWVKRVAEFLKVTVVITNRSDGRIGPAGLLLGRKRYPERFARWLIRRLDSGVHYRIVIAHCDNPDGARQLRAQLVEALGAIGTIHRTDAGSALGAHAGPGTLIVGVQRYTPPLQLQRRLEAANDA